MISVRAEITWLDACDVSIIFMLVAVIAIEASNMRDQASNMPIMVDCSMFQPV